MDDNDASIDPPNGQVNYRRNGKLFSCEPCRKGKLRCDHNSPVCGRCARRNKPDQCIYHPAPLTKPRDSPSTEPPVQSGVQRTAPGSPTASGAYRISPYPPVSQGKQSTGLISPPISNGAASAFRPVNGTSTGQTSLSQSPALQMASPNITRTTTTASSISYSTPESSMSFRDSRHGFLGPTAFSAVYTENPESIRLLEPDEADHAPLPPVPHDKIDAGAQVLALLQDMPRYMSLAQRWFDLCDGFIIMQSVFRCWIDDLWSEFGPTLAAARGDQLRSLSEMVWRNTRKTMPVHGQMTAIEWAKAASGRNLRWEVVGMILSHLGLVAVNLSNWDTIFDDLREAIVDRATFAERMRKASEHCLCFCYECETLNDIYAAFMFQDLVLVECLKGDAHYASWQRTGELCDALVALGIHQGNPVNAQTPFFLSQLRKRMFVSVYGRDKQTAAFLGRPPRLSSRYCKMDMPLDLSDAQVCMEGPELEAALATLDADGWSAIGDLKRVTWLRVWFGEARIREEILEVALGSDDENVDQRSAEIWQRLDVMNASFPAIMRISPEEALKPGQIIPGSSEKPLRQSNALFVVSLHAGVMHTEFLLQRALVNRMKTDVKQLMPISRRLFKLVLLVQAKKDIFRDFQGDLVWMMTFYGLPTAGVLAVELLKQEQSRLYTPDILPRSETIQDLSVFIANLGAVGPGDANFSICNQGRRALNRVLDQILSPTLPPAPNAGTEKAWDDMSFFMPTGNDVDFLQWLETVEWDKGLLNATGPLDGSST